jgi:hypothetical protein
VHGLDLDEFEQDLAGVLQAVRFQSYRLGSFRQNNPFAIDLPSRLCTERIGFVPAKFSVDPVRIRASL